ncbi:MAG: formate dehydrogenase accessory sulfurtransferase FdhD [Colwellia sp.]|nr:formate dehydrogenase accessory sulfurtransferase FdhD [Colwellia sp.]
MVKKIPDNNLTDARAIKTINKYVYCFDNNELVKRVVHDEVIVEQPLQIRLLWHDGRQQCSQVFSITMRTPGNDELLILGLLYSEGVISAVADIAHITIETNENSTDTRADQNLWEVRLNNGVMPKLAALERYQITYSSCGLCGSTSLKSLELKNPPSLNHTKLINAWLNTSDVVFLPKLMREKQQMFAQTGGVHGAALFYYDQKTPQLFAIGEDIGRHNALDKVIGAYIKTATKNNLIVVVSGRISFEIVQKTIMAGISVLIGVGAPSDLAIKAAQRFDLTLIGFASSQSFNVYCGDWRIKTEIIK